ncbi:MAG: three-Cys-motif partner protein TcmP [Sphaerochaeta sp.]|jgi:three-Cys-motif partner protein
MSKVTDDFFKRKKNDWSLVKDDLLENYLKAYMVKLFSSQRPTIYLDCFAGAGKFGKNDIPYEEKEDGSPLIALKTMCEASSISKVYPKPPRLACFIEPKYYEELKTNIRKSEFSHEEFLIYTTPYPDAVQEFLDFVFTQWKNPNLFCYLDPYGVKYLEFEAFKQIRNENFGSLEFLINFNSFGFFRYACSVYEIEIREPRIANDEDVVELDPLRENGNLNQIERLNSIMGNNQWQEIIQDYKCGKINGYASEYKLAEMYKQQLRASLNFRYVLSIPIRFKEPNHPKYRMVYATNHADGAVIMGDVMYNCQDYLFEQYSLSTSGSLNLFSREELYGGPSVEASIIEYLRGKGELGGNEFKAGFYTDKCITAHLIEALKTLEKNNRITIRREPKTTSRHKPSRFFNESKGKHLYISLNE